MNAVYVHCFGGASGDMLLAALLDVGLSLARLQDELGKLPVGGFTLEAQESQRGAIHGTQVAVALTAQARQPRTAQDLIRLAAESALPEPVKAQGGAILQRLAQAEARVHRQPAEQVRLHELGSLDTLVDVMGFVAGLHLMGIRQVYASPLPAGSGWVHAGHGVLPAPAPVTLELLAMAGAPVLPPSDLEPQGERVTPTGAAIITSLASFAAPPLAVERVGYGLGSRDTPGVPNALGLWLGTVHADAPRAGLVVLETNVDDTTPQVLGYAQERLLEAGARDVWFTPIQMKKNRPAVRVSVLADEHLQERMADILLAETSTLGVRFHAVQRYEAERESVSLETTLGAVDVKVKRLGGRVVGVAPEYEACRRIAMAQGLPLQEVYQRVLGEAREVLLSGPPPA